MEARPAERGRGRGGCLRGALVGCGVVLLLILIVVVLVVLNFDRIREWEPVREVTRVAGEGGQLFQDVLKLRAELQREYGTQDLEVDYQVRDDHERIVLRFVNPPFEEEQMVERDGVARDIAAFALERFGRADRLDGVVVIFESRAGPGIRFSSEERHEFTVDELRDVEATQQPLTPEG